jgi:NitT/TauT family transport system permease protein
VPVLESARLKAMTSCGRKKWWSAARLILPFAVPCALILVWHGATVNRSGRIPGPATVMTGLAGFWAQGLLVRYCVASLFRVTWGYLLGVVTALPIGLAAGCHRPVMATIEPFVEMMRPISPLAWIPLAILWCGVGDIAAVFIIFIATFFPMVVATASAARQVGENYRQVGRNYGLSRWQIVMWVLYPAVWRRLGTALRMTLGVAWLVDVAAEMIAVRSGLGFMIIDARNAGDRIDLVIGGMGTIGVIGLLLNTLLSRMQAGNSGWES